MWTFTRILFSAVSGKIIKDIFSYNDELLFRDIIEGLSTQLISVKTTTPIDIENVQVQHTLLNSLEL